MKREARGAPGFTLAELLVASALLSFVMGALYTLTYSTLGAWRSLEHGYDPHGEARNALTVFRHEMENLIPDGGTVFEGKEDEITLLVVSEPLEISESNGAHMMKVRYFLERDGQVYHLMREESLARGAVPTEEQGQSRQTATSRLSFDRGETFQMASNLTDFRIRYVWLPVEGPRDATTPPRALSPVYVSKHQRGWGFPQAVEVSFTVIDPEARLAPMPVRTAFPIRQTTARKSVRELSQME
jgi:prepilin-type N-terminal cleavage/methylation domain-containing protein